MEIIAEQIRQAIIKEITREIFEECINEIDKEIEIGRLEIKSNRTCEHYQYYLDGMVMAQNVIRILEKEKYP